MGRFLMWPPRASGLLAVAGLAVCAWVDAQAQSSGPALPEDFSWHLLLGTSVTFDDNVYLAPNNESDDVIFRVSPGASIEFGEPELTHGSLTVTENLFYYADNDSENDQLLALESEVGIRGGRSSLDFAVEFRQLRQNTRDTGAFATLVRRDQKAARLTGEYEFSPKTSVGAGIAFERADYKVAGLVGSRDLAVPLNYFYELTPKLDLSAGYRYRRSRQSNATNTRYTDHFLNVGGRGEFTAKLSGTLQVGLARRDLPGGGSESTLGLDGNVTWAASVKMNWTGGVSRDFRSSSLNGETVTDTRLNVRGSYEITTFWTVNGGLSYQIADYDSGRSDDFVTGEVSVDYEPSAYVVLSAGISVERNDSNAAASAFDRNTLSVSAGFRY